MIQNKRWQKIDDKHSLNWECYNNAIYSNYLNKIKTAYTWRKKNSEQQMVMQSGDLYSSLHGTQWSKFFINRCTASHFKMLSESVVAFPRL